MLDTTTKRRIDTARDILVGKVPDPKSQVEQITIAMIYKFMDDMDLESEEMGGVRRYFTREYNKYAWHHLFDSTLGGHEVMNLYGEALIKLSQNPTFPQLFRDIFKNAYLPYRDPETLRSFIKVINDFMYDHSEKLGDAFEYLLSVLGSQGDAGQFRTPRHIIDFMVAIIDPKKNETILDPACGTAGFLISSYKHIRKANSSNYSPEEDKPSFAVNNASIEELGALNGKHYTGDKLSPGERTRLIGNISGYDISPDMVRLSLVNLYLHGFTEPHIYEYDTLTSEDRWNEYYDIIMANPPFMSPKGGIRPHKRFSVQSSRSEVLFVDYIIEHLKPTGRAAIIVPEGVIFQSGTVYKQLRKKLVEEHYLVGVISLPAGVFNPYSGVKTSILWIDKTLAKKTDKILFAKISNDGFDLGAQRRPIKLNDLPKVFIQLSDYNSYLNQDEVIHSFDYENLALIEKKEISTKGDYNLSGERYSIKAMEINNDYEWYTLGDVCVTVSGGTPRRSEPFNYTNGKIPWLKSGEIAQGFITTAEESITEYGLNNSSAKVLPVNTVLIAMYGATAGQVGLLRKEASTNQAVCGILPNEKLIPEFLYYSLRSRREYFINVSTGGAQPNISQEIIRKLRMPIPSLSIQKAIIDEIEGYQKIIDGARQVVENYKPRIEIDPDWPVVELGGYIDFISGLTLSIPDCEDINGVPIISMNSITEDGDLTSEGIRRIRIPGKKNINYLQRGDLLFNWRNGSKHLVGKTARFDWDGEYVFASFLIGIRPAESFLLSKYLWYLLNIYRREGEYMAFMRQNVNGLFNREELKILKISLPPIENQQLIIKRIEEEQQLVSANKRLIEIYEQRIKDRIARVWEE